MPTVRVCLWNIQNYGAGNVDKWGANSDLRNRLIRDFCRSHQIDVLLIMEMSVNGQPSLSDLRRKLNAAEATIPRKDWALSYCGSALANGANNPPQNPGDLVYGTDARTEGYAVLWRTNRASYDMVQALNPIATDTRWEAANLNPPAAGPLNMNIEGRPADNVDTFKGAKRTRDGAYSALGGYLPANTLPYRNGHLMAYWPDLEMPTTSVGNRRQLAFEGARRPVYVVLNLNNGQGNAGRLCPVCVYHAPSNLTKASYGALQTGLAKELYVTNTVPAGGVVPNAGALVAQNRVVFGGDYNYSVAQAAWPDEYQYYTQPYSAAWWGGAVCTEVPGHGTGDPARRSTVQILEHDHTTPRAGPLSTDYLVHKLDLVFIPAHAPLGITAERVDMVDELMNDNGAVYGASLQALGARMGIVAGLYAAGPAHQYRVVANGAGPQYFDGASGLWKNGICGSWGGATTDWTLFVGWLNYGNMDPARRAAELYHIFISDHLPLVIEVDV